MRQDISEEEELQTKLMRQEESEEELLQGKLMRQDEEEELQAKSDNPQTANRDGVESQINSAKGGGTHLDNSTKGFMESRFGNDFGDVKIHTDSQASNLNKMINAKAFATGNDIFFREGQYNPGSSDGKHLLAHELTHVVQQNPRRVKPTIQMKGVVPVNDVKEMESKADVVRL
jgi:hypothetical protein